jgi:hypothetical protein
MFLLGQMLYALAAATPAVGHTIHVSASAGSDITGDGSAEHPFASLGKAQAAVRKVLGNHNAVTVEVGPGQYFDTSLTLTELDSPASLDTRVKWISPQPGAATVYGGAQVTGQWKQGSGSNSHIWSVPLSPSLTDDHGRALFRTLVQGERSGWLARSPNFGSGYLGCSGSATALNCGPGVLPSHFDCQVYVHVLVLVLLANLPSVPLPCSVQS